MRYIYDIYLFLAFPVKRLEWALVQKARRKTLGNLLLLNFYLQEGGEREVLVSSGGRGVHFRPNQMIKMLMRHHK